MMPNNDVSPVPVTGPFVEVVNRRTIPLVDYELGGIGIRDTSQGLSYHSWKVEVVGDDVILSAEGVAPVTLFSLPNIKQVTLAFDQSMNPFVAYQLEDDTSYFWWYDTGVSGYTTTQLPAGSINPRSTLDEKRDIFAASSDIILAYMRGTTLYMRMQRDRYGIEYTLAENVEATLITVGMNSRGRLQFKMIPTQD